MVTVQQQEEQAKCLHEIHKEDFQTENYGERGGQSKIGMEMKQKHCKRQESVVGQFGNIAMECKYTRTKTNDEQIYEPTLLRSENAFMRSS